MKNATSLKPSYRIDRERTLPNAFWWKGPEALAQLTPCWNHHCDLRTKKVTRPPFLHSMLHFCSRQEQFLSDRNNSGTKKKWMVCWLPHPSNLGSTPWMGTKPWHYYWCYVVLADRSLQWLSSERLYQQLTETDVDIYTQPLDWGLRPLWKS